MSFWKNRKVLVTGGFGFIGSHVVESLIEQGAKIRISDVHTNNSSVFENNFYKQDIEVVKTDLRNLADCLKSCESIEIVINMAAVVGGVGFNQKHAGSIFRDNMLMNINMLEAARLSGVQRFCVVSSACVYPRHCKIPTPETEGFIDLPEPTNDGYGWAKRMAEFQADAYNREFGMEIAIARPYNAYGPRDNFDPEKSHVIPSLIRRVLSGENPLNVWGSGEQSRSFLYVTDFARGILEVTEKYAACDPVNLGSDEEIKIKDLVKLICRLAGKNITIRFDTSKPTGQLRRKCDTTKAKDKTGFETKVSIEEGIKKTIEWYKENKNRIERQIKC